MDQKYKKIYEDNNRLYIFYSTKKLGRVCWSQKLAHSLGKFYSKIKFPTLRNFSEKWSQFRWSQFDKIDLIWYIYIVFCFNKARIQSLLKSEISTFAQQSLFKIKFMILKQFSEKWSRFRWSQFDNIDLIRHDVFSLLISLFLYLYSKL